MLIIHLNSLLNTKQDTFRKNLLSYRKPTLYNRHIHFIPFKRLTSLHTSYHHFFLSSFPLSLPHSSIHFSLPPFFHPSFPSSLPLSFPPSLPHSLSPSLLPFLPPSLLTQILYIHKTQSLKTTYKTYTSATRIPSTSTSSEILLTALSPGSTTREQNPCTSISWIRPA